MIEKSNGTESNRLLLSALFVTGFATHARTIISSLLLIEIGDTFNVPVGIAGQVTTAAASIAIIAALIMGALSMRYSPRTLLLTGMSFYTLSAIGCYIAPSFSILLIAFALSGAGGAMVIPMLGTIIGETLPKEDRSKGLGLILAGQPVSFVVGTPLVSYIAARADWRLAFLGYMLPVVILSAIIIYYGVPKTQIQQKEQSIDTMAGFRGVLSSRSAVGCLIGTTLYQASMWTAFSFIISFFRESFMMSADRASWLLSALTVMCAIGSVTSGSVVKRFGRQRSAVIGSILLGVMVIVIYNLNILWVSIGGLLIWGYIIAFGYVSGDSLTLDQVPDYRGTLMSLNAVSRSAGAMIGTLIGGYVLLNFNYSWFGLVMGLFGISASLVYGLIVTEMN